MSETANDDKGSEVDVSANTSACGTTPQDFGKSNTSRRAPAPHELTAEWTVRAQLKFARAGDIVRKEFSTKDPVNPVRILYKWGTVDGNITTGSISHEGDNASNMSKRNSSKSSAYSQDPTKNSPKFDFQKEGSSQSTTSTVTCGDNCGGDSAFSGSNNSNRRPGDTLIADVKDSVTNFYGTRCHSTCNIIVTAVADFLSPSEAAEISLQEINNVSIQNPNIKTSKNLTSELDSKPPVIHTTASYTVMPEKDTLSEGFTKSKTCSFTDKIPNLRDAVCQTSDTETKYFREFERKRVSNSRSPLERHNSRRQQSRFKSRVSEGSSFMPSYVHSPAQTLKSSSVPRILTGTEGGIGVDVEGSSLPAFKASEKPSHPSLDQQKKPRTVHIDVYCTGSEDDDQADGESSSDSDDKKFDQISNSTLQTVLENEQMRLRHHRITGQSLPRRLAEQNKNITVHPTEMSENLKGLNIGHALTKSSTAEEVHESKQLLFRKHIGDQRAAKLQNLRQKYLRQSSDDTLSLGYPNSSRSTVRENTCSSMSSVFAGQDFVESSWKESDEHEELPYFLTKSDSFEYENALDRLRIRQMERLWSHSHSNDDESKSQSSFQTQPGSTHLQTISEDLSLNKKSTCVSNIRYQETLSCELDNQMKQNQLNDNCVRLSPVPIALDSPNNKFQQTSHFSENKPGFLQFFGPNVDSSETPSQLLHQSISTSKQQYQESTLRCPEYKTGLQRWKSEAHNNLSVSTTPILEPKTISRQNSPQSPANNNNFQRSGSEAPPSTTSADTFPVATPTPARRFGMYHRPSPAISEASSQPPPPGYSSEYLDKAKVFGRVVTARKPGHHVGPTKNPNCSCESCQRWLAERFQIRGRAFSLSEMPILKKSLPRLQ